jgi:hypothetical protein
MPLVQEVMSVARDVCTVFDDESRSRARGTGNEACEDTGNGVCVESRRAVEDTGNRVWGVRTRTGRDRRGPVRWFASYSRYPGRDAGKSVCVPWGVVEVVLRRISVWTRNTGGCA